MSKVEIIFTPGGEENASREVLMENVELKDVSAREDVPIMSHEEKPQSIEDVNHEEGDVLEGGGLIKIKMKGEPKFIALEFDSIAFLKGFFGASV